MPNTVPSQFKQISAKDSQNVAGFRKINKNRSKERLFEPGLAEFTEESYFSISHNFFTILLIADQPHIILTSVYP
jgi:hypothetical protein